MPRTIRERSISGFYHIMSRGHNKQQIFYDNQDRGYFLKLLRRKKEGDYLVHAYCLMPNHFHLVLQEQAFNASNIMKTVNERYAQYFNRKYKRIGALFQGRFKSRAINDDAYLLTVVRYIHQNPVAAGIVAAMHEYKWSSYLAYLNNAEKFIYKDFVMRMYGEYGPNPMQEFIEAHSIMLAKDDLTAAEIKRDDGKEIDKLNDTWVKIKKLPISFEEKVVLLHLRSQMSITSKAKIIGLSRQTVSRILNKKT